MKVILTIWISVVLIQEVVPSALIRLPRHSPAPKASIHTEYEAKYAQKGKHGNESFSLVKGNQEFHHDHCGENWNEFAEKCATLIKELIGSLANVVSSKPGDATNLQLHIKNSFKHFDSSHNCSCVNCAGKDLSNLDLSSLFNNITIETSPENAALACKDLSDAIQSNKLTNGASPSNINPLRPGINPEDVEAHGDKTNNSRRQTDVLHPLTSANPNPSVPEVDNAQGKNYPLFPLKIDSSKMLTKSESFSTTDTPLASTPKIPQSEKTVFGPYTYPPPPSASQTTPIKLSEGEAKPVILPASGKDTPLFAPEIAGGTNNDAHGKFLPPKITEVFPEMKPNTGNPTSSQAEKFNPVLGNDSSSQSTPSYDYETDTKNEAPSGALNPTQVISGGPQLDHLSETKSSGPELNDAALPFVFPPFLKPPKTYSKEDEDKNLNKLIGSESKPKHSISEPEQSFFTISPGSPNSGLNIPKIVDHSAEPISKNPLISGEQQIFSSPHGLAGSVPPTEPGFILEKLPSKKSSNPDDCDDNTASTLITPGKLPNLMDQPKHQGTTSQPTLPPPESQLNNHLPLSSSSGKGPSPAELPNYPGVNAPINKGTPTMSPPHIGKPELPGAFEIVSTTKPEDCEDSKSLIIPPHVGQGVIPGAIPSSQVHISTIMPPHTGQINIPGIIPPSQGHGSTIIPPHAGQVNIPEATPAPQGITPVVPPQVGQSNFTEIIPPPVGSKYHPPIIPSQGNSKNIPETIPVNGGYPPNIISTHADKLNSPGATASPKGQPPTMPPHAGQANIPGAILPPEGSATPILPSHGGQLNNAGEVLPPEGPSHTISLQPHIPGAPISNDGVIPTQPNVSKKPDSSPAGGTLSTTISTPFSEVLPVVKPGKLGQSGLEGIHNAQDPTVLASEPDCESPDSSKGVEFVTLKSKSTPQGAHTINPEEITGGPGLIVPPTVSEESQIIDSLAPGVQIARPEPDAGVLNHFGLKPFGSPSTTTHSSDKNDEDCEDKTKDQHSNPMVIPSEIPHGVNIPTLSKHDIKSAPDSLNANQHPIIYGGELGPDGKHTILPPSLNTNDMVIPTISSPAQNTSPLLPTSASHSKNVSPDNIFEAGLPQNDLTGGANAHDSNAPIGSSLNHNSEDNLPLIGGHKDGNKEDCPNNTSSTSGNDTASSGSLGLVDYKNPQSHDFVQVPLAPEGTEVPIPTNPEPSHVMHIGKPNNPNNILSPVSGKLLEQMNSSTKAHSERHPMTPGVTKDTETSHSALFPSEGIHPVFGPVNQRPIKVPGSMLQHKPAEIVTPVPVDSSDQLVRPTANPTEGSNEPLSSSQMTDATLPGPLLGANHGGYPRNPAVSGQPSDHLSESLGPHAPLIPSDSYPPVVSGIEPPTPFKTKSSNHPATGTTHPNYDETSLKPTTFQTTSVEPTPPLVDSHLPPPLLTIPYHQTSPHTPYNKNSARPSSKPIIFPTEKDALEDDDEDEEDCCSCEACVEGENKSPKEYRVAVCQDLEEARRELKAIFDKIRKKLKCGRKTIKTFGPS